MKRNQITVFLFIIIIFGFLLNVKSIFGQQPFKPVNDQKLIINTFQVHDPIVISSDSDFLSLANEENWAGDGSENNPFIIEGYLFNEEADYQISIFGVTYNFKIINNIVSNGQRGGIKLNGVTKATITNNHLVNNTGDGIFLIQTSNIVISNNIINNTLVLGEFLVPCDQCTRVTDFSYSIDVQNSTQILVESNTITNARNGIHFNYAVTYSTIKGNYVKNIDNNGIYDGFDGSGLGLYPHNNTLIDNYVENVSIYGLSIVSDQGDLLIKNNTIFNCTRGILFLNSYNSEIVNNTIMNSSSSGLVFNGAPSSTFVAKNIFENNRGYGMNIAGRNNTITENIYINNNNNGKQAVDLSYSNVNTIQYNYWNDWIEPDIDEDGIVDSPYILDGFADTKDNYPLAQFEKPTIIDEPETTSTIISETNNFNSSTSSEIIETTTKTVSLGITLIFLLIGGFLGITLINKKNKNH
ncbi:MAG: right-handed parallel beta-helix repeat-containing protein [Candidatus Hodarchaeales archaeon]|jgi:parallel beta-helix repeat protein